MSRKYSPQEIIILRNHQPAGKETFTESDLKALTDGEATIKLEYRADKVIEHYVAFVTKPPSRKEVQATFLSLHQYAKEVGAIETDLIVLRETLIRLNILTQEQLDNIHHILVAERWLHLCDDCINKLPECKGEPKFGIDIFPELTGALADKVVECNQFTRPPMAKEGNC